MKTKFIEQDLIIIKTINELISKNQYEALSTMKRFQNGEIDEESYVYILEGINKQIAKYVETINQIKGVK